MVQFSLAILTTLLVSCTIQSALGQECKRVEYTEDKCRKDKIEVFHQTVTKGTSDARLILPGSQDETEWFCIGNDGSRDKERVGWGWQGLGNHIRVNYRTDGTIEWTIYLCDGNPSAWATGAQKCASVDIDVACPTRSWFEEWVYGPSEPCTYELSRGSSSSNSKTTVSTVSANVAGEVQRKGATVSGGIGWSGSTTDAHEDEISYNDKLYLVLPPGAAYCTYIEGTTVADIYAPLKYKWQCSQSSTMQREVQVGSSSSCSELPRCEGLC